MKFIFFIVSTMLIVLISQHSTMGLPVNITVVEEACSEGFELIDGKCTPINSTTISTEVESSSLTSEEMIIHEEEPVTELNLPKKFGACPEGMTHDEHGICEEIQSLVTTEVNVELTTVPNENIGGVENIKGCPEGTESGEQGECEETKPSNSTKMITDPKALLNEDGSCPDNYKMIEGRCLYIKLKINSTSYPGGSIVQENVSILLQPKTGIEQSSKVELGPVLPDNSCPEGTEYSEYGLCQKRIHGFDSNPRMKPDGSCPDDFELIDGKCTYRNSKIHIQLESTTKLIDTITNTTISQDAISSEEFSTSTFAGESSEEPQSTVTFSPL